MLNSVSELFSKYYIPMTATNQCAVFITYIGSAVMYFQFVYPANVRITPEGTIMNLKHTLQ